MRKPPGAWCLPFCSRPFFAVCETPTPPLIDVWVTKVVGPGACKIDGFGPGGSLSSALSACIDTFLSSDTSGLVAQDERSQPWLGILARPCTRDGTAMTPAQGAVPPSRWLSDRHGGTASGGGSNVPGGFRLPKISHRRGAASWLAKLPYC